MNEKRISGKTIWAGEAVTELDRLTIEADASLCAPEGKAVVLEVNGDLCDPVPGTYEGSVRVRLMDAMENWGEMTGPYRSGLFFDEDGLNPGKSALAGRLPEGENTVRGLDLTVRGNFLNGISCDGGRVLVEDSTLRFLGNGDDFRLAGTAVAAGGNADLTIRNSAILSEGVAATTVAVGGKADVLIDHCTLQGTGAEDPDYYLDNHHLTVVPWVLGLRGTVRASNLLENGTVTYYNSSASCNGWGVLSVDMTKDAVHNVINVRASIPSGEGYDSGYCTYLLGGTTSTFLGCEFDVPDYVFAVGGNDHHTLVGPSSRENLMRRRDLLGHLDRDIGLENVPERPCVIRAGKYAGMWHHSSTGKFEILPGTAIEAGVCAFLIKSGDKLNTPDISCDGVSVSAPILVHLMESDDPGMGNYGRDKSWAPYYECICTPNPGDGHDLSSTEQCANATFRSMAVSGDCFNTKWKTAQNLHLVFDRTTLTGTISSAGYVHREFSWGIAETADGSRVCTDPDGRPYRTQAVEDMLFGKMPVTYRFPVYGADGQPVYEENSEPLPRIGYAISLEHPEFLGDVEITASEPVGNGVIVELKNGSVWNVTAPGWITSLSIEEGCTLNGRLLLDGQAVPALPESYRGAIQVLPV